MSSGCGSIFTFVVKSAHCSVLESGPLAQDCRPRRQQGGRNFDMPEPTTTDVNARPRQMSCLVLVMMEKTEGTTGCVFVIVVKVDVFVNVNRLDRGLPSSTKKGPLDLKVLQVEEREEYVRR